MNFGTYDFEQVIFRQLAQANARFDGVSYKKFSKDLTKRLFELMEADLNKGIKDEAKSRGVSNDVIEFIDRASKALGFSMMPMDEVSIDAYKWIAEQEMRGQTIEAFSAWARNDEQGKYIGKYRKSAGSIKNDWARAFFVKETIVMRSSDEGI